MIVNDNITAWNNQKIIDTLEMYQRPKKVYRNKIV